MQNLKLAVVIPVFNDWAGLPNLIQDLHCAFVDINQVGSICLFIVDDGSVIPRLVSLPACSNKISRLEIIKIGCNLGHQRAIAIGLSEVVSRSSYDAVLVMDSDNEDKPSDALVLLNEWRANPEAVIVARRKGRNEGPAFRMFYRIYLRLFHYLSGRKLDFGNFAVLSSDSAKRLVYMPELWNHFAASILKSRLPLVRIPMSKGMRLHGMSKMNFVSLVNHGLSAASVLIDVVFTRLLIGSTAAAALLVAASAYVLYQKFFTVYAIPGWASSMVGLSLLGLLQIFALIFVIVFLILSNRSNFQRPTLYQAKEYIESITICEN